MNDLELYREQLALCDDKIIDALVERNSIIEKIMAYKEEYGMSIIQPKQEEKQERQLEIKLDGNKYSEEIEDVFRRIRRNSKRILARKLFDYNIVLAFANLLMIQLLKWIRSKFLLRISGKIDIIKN